MRAALRILGICAGVLSATAGATALPYQGTDRHVGVASCASSVCHGAVQPSEQGDVLLNEYVTWAHNDKHAQAYQVLLGEQARNIAAKLGLASATTARICLDCHTDNVPSERRSSAFRLTDGVGCEACHGGAEHWLASHSAPGGRYADNVRNGMYPTADVADRAMLCLSCHYGNADKFATHRIMGAGHPRLSFELDTFQALQPPHYRIDASYQQRKPTYRHAQLWAFGVTLAAQAQVRTLLNRANHADRGAFPELALFNCGACHDTSMHRLDWRRRAFTRDLDPGTVPLEDAALRMVWIIAQRLDPQLGDALLEAARTLQTAAATHTDALPLAAARLGAVLDQVLQRLRSANGVPPSRALLVDVIQDGIDGEYRDYLGAEQALMAIDTLMLDANVEAAHRAELDQLYALMKSDETYRPEAFITALKSLSATLQ